MPDGSPRTIDMHAHAAAPRVAELTAGRAMDANPHNQHLQQTRYRQAFSDIGVRLATMERAGIDMQVVSPAPNYGYWADADVSQQIIEAANTHIADLCRDHPGRFLGLGHVSLQHPDLAARQIEDVLRLDGMRGVEIGTNVNGKDLDDEQFEPFWAAANQHSAIVFLHPAGTTLGPRVAQYYLTNIIGNPLDTTLALSHLIFGGVLERHPRVKVLAAHGGGYLPSYFPRTQHGFEVRPEAQTNPHPPEYYLQRLWVDSLVYRAPNLAHLIRQMGPSQVVLGTDYPYDMGEESPLAVLKEVTSVTEPERERIMGGNARALLGID